MKHLVLIIGLSLVACATATPPEQRQLSATALTTSHGWQKLRLPASEFVLTAFAPVKSAKVETLTVYIEGDGQAWLTRSIASDDPTPRNPIALHLTLRHQDGAAAYLARPCQFTSQADWGACRKAYWTEHRFAPEVIASNNIAIDALKQRFGASKLVLVGYSGGGAVAALVAARRRDVVRLVTVAGNLDHVTWSRMHSITPLKGSLNAADVWEDLQDVPQLHLVGGNDKNVSIEVAEAFAARFPSGHRPAIRVVPGADHGCCWVEQWPGLLSQPSY